MDLPQVEQKISSVLTSSTRTVPPHCSHLSCIVKFHRNNLSSDINALSSLSRVECFKFELLITQFPRHDGDTTIYLFLWNRSSKFHPYISGHITCSFVF